MNEAVREVFGEEVDSISSRVFQSMQAELEGMTFAFVGLLNEECESPIERMLGAAICLHAHMYWSLFGLHCVFPWQKNKQKEPCGPNTFLLIPQFKHGIYRFDFALTNATGVIALVECDGHDFHERTKEQAAHDRQKDRFAQISGIPILRYTGSEIYADPQWCASQVLDFVEKAINAQQPEIAETAT